MVLSVGGDNPERGCGDCELTSFFSVVWAVYLNGLLIDTRDLAFDHPAPSKVSIIIMYGGFRFERARRGGGRGVTVRNV